MARPAVVVGHKMRFSRKDPMNRGVDRQGRDGRGPGRMARPAVVAGRGMRFSRKDPMNQRAGPQGRDGRGPGRMARPAVVAGRGMRFSCKDPMNQRAGRQGRDPAGPGWWGPGRTARLAQPASAFFFLWFRICFPASPGRRAVHGYHRRLLRAEPPTPTLPLKGGGSALLRLHCAGSARRTADPAAPSRVSRRALPPRPGRR